MKAIVLTEYGDADRLQLRDVPDPKPGPDQIAVRVAAASINPIDWKLRSGAFRNTMPLELPAILGRDVAGTVVARGSGAPPFDVGARVLGLAWRAYAEIVVAGPDAWAEVPAGMNLVDAAALPLAVLTGAQLVEEAVNVREGEALLVTGATGSVGRAAVFAARGRGARVYAGVRARHKSEAARLDVQGVVAIDDEVEIASLPPVDAIADTVGGETTRRLLDRVKSGGRIGSVVGPPPGSEGRQLVIRPIFTHPDPRRLGALARAVAEGKLVIPIARKFPLREAAAAQTFAATGADGKVVLTVD